MRVSAPSRAASLRHLHALVSSINGGLDVDRTLQAVCQGVVDGLGFEAAVVNLVLPDGALEVVAVAGSQDAYRALFGSRAGRAEWDQVLAACTPVGALLVDYDHADGADAVASWVPDTPVSDDPDDWHPLDALFAPLHTATSGLLGVLSVDLPRDGRRPGPEQLELLELYAAQASVAIENAQLHAAQGELVGRLTAVVSEVPVAIVELGLDGLVREWNPEAERIFGWTRAEVLGRRNPTVESEDYEGLLAGLAGGAVVRRSHVRRRRKDGTLVDVELSNRALRDADGRVFGYLGALVDVSERVALEAELRTAAFSDALTGLPNRARFREHLDLAVAHDAAADGAARQLLLLDLDGFKGVNDTLGHAVGDALLAQVARRIVHVCGRDDVPARLGGDEFVVLVRGDEQAATALADRLVRGLAQPFELAGQEVTIGCSVGVATVTGASAADVLRNADIAMYAAKAGGKGTTRVFAPELVEPTPAEGEPSGDPRAPR